MNVTTTESTVLSISEATLLHRQPRFGYIPLLAIFLSNLLSNTAVAKFIPLGSLRLSYDPIPILKPVSQPTPSHHHYPYAPPPPPPPPVSSEEVQHIYHHHHLPHVNQNQIVNILDKKPTEIVVETDTEEATESSTEHQEYRDDEIEKPGIEEISDKSAKTLFKRGISINKEKGHNSYSNHQKPRPSEIEVENVATESSFGDSSRIDGLEKPAMSKSINLSLKRETDRLENLNKRTFGHPSNVGHVLIAHPLPLLSQHQVVTPLYRKTTNNKNEKANEYQVFKSDGLGNFENTGKRLLKKGELNDHKMIKNEYDHALSLRDRKNDTNLLNQKLQEVFMRSSIDQRRSSSDKTSEEINKESPRLLVKRTTVGEDIGNGQYEFEPEVMKSGEAYQPQKVSESNENYTHFEVEVGSGMKVSAENQDSVNIGIELEESGIGKIGDGILLSSDVGSQKKNYTNTIGGDSGQEVKEYGNGLEKPIFEIISGRSMRALVKRGTANRYRVRKNNKYLYQKRRRVPDYYYDSFEDITTSRYYKPRRRPTRPRKPIDSYEDIYDSNEDYDYDYEVKPHKNRRRPTTTTRPRRTNPRPTNRRRLPTTTSEYDDDDYAIEVVPRQGSTTITNGETNRPSSTTPGSTSTVPSSTTVRPTGNTTNATTGYGYGPSHGHEGISITYGPPTGGGHALYGPPSTSYGHPQPQYGPPSTQYGTPNNGFGPSSHGYYQVPFSDWYSNEVSRTAIAKKAQDIIGFENIFN